MNINLKPFQQKAVDKLVDTLSKLLAKDVEKKVCVFRAPTGSGKTLMTAKVIEGLIEELPSEDLCFIWVSIGKGELHIQSKHSLEKVYEGAPKVTLVEEDFSGGRECIDRNEVVVANWEKLRSKDRETGEWKNILMKDGEQINFREVMSKTRERRKIILVIDESHIGALAERTNELREEINADVVLEMSATPTIQIDVRDLARETAGYVEVDPKEAIEEGMIKKELIINEKIASIAKSEIDSQEVVLEAAYIKRLELVRLYETEKVNINPLVLIQIPTSSAGEDKINAIKKFLTKKGINVENGKLAIWLAEQKSETLDSVSEPDNKIEYLIFKQAIDTGWDCPRAHILIKFREMHSETFEIQTVGRILRMPEQKHYSHEALNRGYIYTNIQSIAVARETYNPNIIKHLKAVRIDSYKNIGLMSYYKSRIDFGDITATFTPTFEDSACRYFALAKDDPILGNTENKLSKKGIILDIDKYKQDIIADAKIEGKTFDELLGDIPAENRVLLTIAGNDLQALFEQVIKDHLGSFKNIKRSIPDVKTAIYSWFRKYLKSKQWKEEIVMIQKVFVDDRNRGKFEELLESAINDYKVIREKEIQKKSQASEQFYEFEIAKEDYYNEYSVDNINAKKYVLKPCFLYSGRFSPEKAFETFLEKNHHKIVWWWKNGESRIDYFGVKYEYPKGSVHTFYPDYMMQLADGRIGIIEVKDIGDRDGATYTRAKAERLSEYIKQQKRKEIFGGIVIEKLGEWKINNKEKYEWEKCEKNDWSDWEKLVL